MLTVKYTRPFDIWKGNNSFFYVRYSHFIVYFWSTHNTKEGRDHIEDSSQSDCGWCARHGATRRSIKGKHVRSAQTSLVVGEKQRQLLGSCKEIGECQKCIHYDKKKNHIISL